MRILGADIAAEPFPGRGGTLVALDEAARVVAVRNPSTLLETASAVIDLAGDEPFLLGIGLPVVVPMGEGRGRAVDHLVQRRLGVRLRAVGRPPSPGGRGVSGDALLGALAAAGRPCLPYPDRDRRTSGLAEAPPALALKVLLWEGSILSAGVPEVARVERFRALEPPEYRSSGGRARGAAWASRAAALDLALRSVGNADGYDLEPVRSRLEEASGDDDVDRAASLLDAVLSAGTARRYLERPEACVFLGDRREGYVILPADALVRRMALREVRVKAISLFPRGSLRERLASLADLRTESLLEVPGRAARVEAQLHQPPLYEFDNVDEMLWWKHCRHLAGAALPTEGLVELTIVLGSGEEPADPSRALRLSRSRHRTLSFRFDPPEAWRTRVPTRDGRTYPFRVLRAAYDTSGWDR